MPTPPRRRWFQFSLATMFVVVTAVTVCLGWQLKVVRDRSAMKTWIVEHGGQIIEEHGRRYIRKDLQPPQWRQWFGDHPIDFIMLDSEAATEDEFDRIGELFPESNVNLY